MKGKGKIVKTPTPRGGQSNVRGVLVQTLIALLDALLGAPGCQWLKLEPNLSSEKFDLIWQDSEGMHAVQVKTSINRFKRAAVDRLTHEMKANSRKDFPLAECRLVLVGQPAEDLDGVEKLNGVVIDIRSQTDQDFIEQAAPRLHEFLDREKLGSVKAWFHKVIVGHLATQLASASTKGARVDRAVIVADLKRWVTASPNYRLNASDSSSNFRWPEDIISPLRFYLEKVAEECRHVALIGIDPKAGDMTDATTPELAKVFVQVNTTELSCARTRLWWETPEAAPPFNSSVFDLPEREPLRAIEAIFTNDRCVFLGAPGSGKSSLFRYLAFCLAKQHLQPEEHQLEDLLAKIPNSSRPVPFRLELRRLSVAYQAQPPAAGDSCHIWAYVADWMKKKNLESAMPALQAAFEQGHALVLLDGLDEVPERFQRFVRQAIESFATGGFCRCRVAVTCRVKSYLLPELRLGGFKEFTLEGFTLEQTRQFVHIWYKECANKGRMSAEEAAQCTPSLVNAMSNERLKEMAGNPMYLTAMACLHTTRAGQPLPEATAKLFDLLVETLLFLWAKTKLEGTTDQSRVQDELGSLLQEGGCSGDKLRRTLERLAFRAHRDDLGIQRGGWAPANISEDTLLLELAKLDGKGMRLEWAKKVIEAIRHRAGLLQSDDGQTFQFTYRFQEFLAGGYLADKDAWEKDHKQAHAGTQMPSFALRAAALFDAADYWRNVITWSAGIRAHVRGDLGDVRDLIYELCKGPSLPDAFGRRKLFFAADLVREARLHDLLDLNYGLETVDDLRRRLLVMIEGTETSKDFSLRERVEAASQIGWIEDRRPGVGVRHRPDQKDIPDLSWARVIHPGEFIMGEEENWAGRRRFSHRIEHPYCVALYPITVAQYELFIQDGGYEREDLWVPPAGWQWRESKKRKRPDDFTSAFQTPNHPRVGVTWYEAAAFCNWLNTAFTHAELNLSDQNWKVRLPTEAEWERAARHTDGREFPWDSKDQADPASRCNCWEAQVQQTCSVGLFPSGKAVCEAQDMAGNVWEWCLTKWRNDYQSYESESDKHRVLPDTRVLRGGSCYSSAQNARCAYRRWNWPENRDMTFGFRVAASPFSGL